MRHAWIAARSVSRQVKEWLDGGPTTARVLAVSERVCDLVTSDGDVIALVGPQIGDGPLNVVLDAWTNRIRAEGLFYKVQPGTEIVYDAGWLQFPRGEAGSSLCAVAVDLRGAALWEPCPEWDRLRARQNAMLPYTNVLRALCLVHGASSSLLPLLGAAPPVGAMHAIQSVGLDRAREAAANLRAGWGGTGGGHVASVRRGGAALAGLGGGLTPAGDDFLVGLMLWAWLAHPSPRLFCQALAAEAAPRTTILSAALLRAAARGHCCAAWQRLFWALADGREADVLSAGQQVLSFGASSGADALVGFLYMAAGVEVPGRSPDVNNCLAPL